MFAVRVECRDRDAEFAVFRDEVGCAVDLVSPADDPRVIRVRRGDDAALELVRYDIDRPLHLVVAGHDAARLVSPGGTVVDVEAPPADTAVGAEMTVPDNQPSLVVVGGTHGDFGVGRAGMEYRDLLPDRWGGRFIASHIHIGDGGDVADWVHFHRIRFQMIYVAAGWVDVVYEGQGEPFRMHPGDCVLQPPEIRHRVLRSSAGLEVIEVGCPAEHDTIADHGLELPDTEFTPDRDFSGQRFVRHIAADATGATWVDPTMVAVATGIADATNSLAGVATVAASAANGGGQRLTHDGEFVLLVGLAGDATLDIAGASTTFGPRSSVAVPPGTRWAWSERSSDHRALVVELPANTIRQA